MTSQIDRRKFFKLAGLATAGVMALVVLAAPASAGEDSTDRYWNSGPAWYDIPCGLACFRLWEQAGLEAGDVSLAQLKRARTPADLHSAIEARLIGAAGAAPAEGFSAARPGSR